MATKPTNAATWDSNSTNLIAPTAGHKTDGFAVDEVPSSSEVNGQLKLLGEWTAWLLDGDLGDLTFDNITITGSSTYTGDGALSLTASQTAVTTTDLHVINVTADTDFGWTIGGLAGGAAGRELLILNVGSNSFFIEDEDGGATAADRIVTPGSADLLMPAGACIRLRYTSSRWRVISTSGCLKFGVIRIPASAAAPAQSDSDHGDGQITVVATESVFFPFSVPAGSYIQEWRIYIQKITDGGVTIGGILKYRPSNGAAADVGTSDSDNTNAPGYTVLVKTGLDHLVPTSERQYYLYFSTSGVDAGDNDKLLHAGVTGWFPY